MATTRQSVITIEELDGPRRRLDLIASGLPRQGATWGIRLRANTTWNPGNAYEATQQVLGPEELPTEWNGVWRTTLLASAPCKFTPGPGASAQPVALASSLRDVFELIVSSGMRLRVTWTEGLLELGFRSLMREGLCTQATFPHDRMDDIGWSATFEWAGRGTGKAPTTPDLGGDKSISSLRAANQQLADYLSETTQQQIVSDRTDVPGSASAFTLGQLEAIADIPKDFAKQLNQFATLISNRVQRFAGIITKGASIPTLAASTVLECATIAVQGFSQSADQMSRDMPDALNNVEGDAAALISAASYFAVHQEAADNLLGVFAQIKEDAKRRRSGMANQPQTDAIGQQLKAVTIARMGDTFVSLSIKFYNSPDLGEVIARANGISEYAVGPAPGTTLIIPVVTTQQQSQQF